ncbi:MAG TPA: hypothetical protein VI357_08300, partial [Mycobacteriales bacterium]
HGYDPLPGTSPRPIGPVTDDKAPPGSPARPAEGYGPPPGTSRRPIGPATEYDPPPGGSLPPAVRSDGYGSLGEPRSRRARREAAERAARPTESYRPISPGDYSPSAYLPPEGLPGPAGLPGTASPAAHSNSPDDTGHTDQLRPPADGASRLHPAVHRVDRPPADGAGGVRPPRRSRSGSRSAVDAGQRPAGEPGELPASPPDELQPRRARREAGTARPDDPRRSQKRERPRTGATRVTDQLSRARRRRSVVAVLTSVVLALALAAGGVWWFTLRQAGVPPDDYATSICGSVRDWQQSVDSSNSTLITTIAREQNRTAVRSAVSAYYTSIAGRTDQLRASILDAGVADVPGGRAYADSLAAAVGTEATDLRGLAARAGRLDPAAAATFQIELQSLLTGSETTVGTVSSALARPSAGTPTVLRAALSAEPSCAPYVG